MNFYSPYLHTLRGLNGILSLFLAFQAVRSHAEQSPSSPAPEVKSPPQAISSHSPTPEPSPEKLTKREAARLFQQALDLQQGVGVAPDPVKARELYFRAARAGETRAMQNLGVMLLAGAGVPAAPAEGYHWIRCGADSGDPKALFSCSLLLRMGAGTEKDPALASAMMQRSAGLGYIPAQVSVADDCLSGENGVPKDPKRAGELLLLAAKAGHDGAALRVSDLYKNGTGVPKDSDKADEWLARAARLGNAHAQFLYAHKLMASKGPQAAYPWAKLAEDRHYIAVHGIFLESSGLLSPEQLRQGDKEADAIKAAYPPVSQ